MCEKCGVKKFSEEEMLKMKLADQCGLAYGGRDDEGELNFIGSKKQWKKFEDLKTNNNL